MSELSNGPPPAGELAAEPANPEEPGAEVEAEDAESSDGERDVDWAALGDALSPGALAALQEHFHAKDEAAAQDAEGGVEVLPSEDFGMSQFWWDDRSAEALAQEALDLGATNVAILSAPSVYAGLQRILQRRQEAAAATVGGSEAPPSPPVSAVLLEYDPRFEAMAGAEFQQYDYNALEALPTALHGRFDFLLAGPPYVSVSCVEEYVRAFALLGAQGADTPCAIVIGETLEESLEGIGFAVDHAFEPSYQSKFCTPMRLYRKNYAAPPLPNLDAAAAAAR